MTQAQTVDRLIAQALASDLPAGQILQRHFKNNAQIGSKDRLRIADAFWQSLRSQALPKWLSELIAQAIGTEELALFAAAIAEPASLDVRVNLANGKPEKALERLRAEGIEAVQSEILEEALRVQGKPNIERSQAFQSGLIEAQDLGSQLLARLASVRRSQTIVDFCAGAGGKTLALASALRGSGRVYAIDVSSARLAKLKPRLERSRLGNVWPLAISTMQDARLERIRAKADIVFVDAPCSGTGTLRRSPDLKWRLSPDKLSGFVSLQNEILTAASRLVRPGGRLVYGTCSVLSLENDQVIDRFLLERPEFCRVSCESVLLGQGVSLPASWRAFSANHDLSLWPHRTATDGFYGAVLALGG